ncbi:hypothetical protein BT69DRAFT_1343068 [Atractiella rhizophila]|nr:hypothetical protein BT69DRAFT_1343068 [Atractiella rhizophila]
MSPSSSETGPDLTLEDQLALALQRASLEEALSANRTYLTACFAIYCWDFVLTFPNEYTTMWKAQRWTPVRFAFFFNRYWSLLSVVLTMCFAWLEFAPKTCDRVQVLVPVAGIFVFLGCEFLFGARVWVMWNRRTWIAYFFGILALAGATVQVWAVTHNMALRLPPGLRGCLSVRADQK